jgi:hypothetical protein
MVHALRAGHGAEVSCESSSPRYTAHAGSDNSLQETRAYFAKMAKTADDLGFEMPNFESLGVYLK